jgi:hypothetical protein
MLALMLAAGGVFEHSFEASRDYAAPLHEVRAEATFRCADGAHKVFLFWDGGRTWKLRFSPSVPGVCQFTIASSDAGLDGRSGKLKVTKARGGAQPVRLSASRLSFTTLDGKPWFWLGDTAWNGALLSTREEWDEYLAARARQRFTAVQFVMTQWRAGRRDEAGRTAFSVDGGTVRVDPAFFRRMDERVAAVNRHGLIAAPVLLWALTSRDKESPGESLDPGQVILLARYMVARYNAYAVCWLLGGDGDYRAAQADKWKRIGRGAFPEGFDRRPVTLHPRGMQDPWPGLAAEPWLDFFMYQSGHGDSPAKWRWAATQGMATGWKLAPPHPVIDGEINYEGHIAYQSKRVIEPAAVRRAAYYSLLSGATAGVTYGAHGIWFWSRKPEVPLDHPSTGVALPWRECLRYEGAAQMKILRDLFDRFAWWKLRPDRALLAEDADAADFSDHVMASRATDGSFAVLYTPTARTLRLNTAGFRRAVWLNPRDGVRRPAPLAATMTPPGPGDWLLLLTR